MPAASSSSRRATPATATSPPTPPWCSPRRPAPIPRALADLIAADLRDDPRVAKAEVAGPGFINLTPRRRRASTTSCAPPSPTATASAGAGRARAGRSTSNTSPPTRPARCMSGHGRGAVFGDALATSRPSPGCQGDARVLHQRRRARRSTCSPAPPSCATARRWARTIGAIPEGLYPGDYLKPVGAGARPRARPTPARHARGRVAAARPRRPPSTP